MNKKIDSNKYIELYFDEELSIYKWKFLPASKYIDPGELKEIIEFKNFTLRKYRPEYVIADDRDNLATYSVELQEWIAGMAVESLKLCNSKKFAVLLPKEMVVELSTEQTVEEVEKLGGNFETRMFSELEEAMEWIKS